jgi:hypothetical protein
VSTAARLLISLSHINLDTHILDVVTPKNASRMTRKAHASDRMATVRATEQLRSRTVWVLRVPDSGVTKKRPSIDLQYCAGWHPRS